MRGAIAAGPGTRAPRVLLAGLFGAALLAPCAAMLLDRTQSGDTEAENRRATPLPGWSWDLAAIQAFPSRFEAFFGDALGLRSSLLRLNARLELGLFGQFPGRSMAIGRDDFWFFEGDDSLAQHRGLRALDEAELASWERTLRAQSDWCRARGIGYLFVIGPSKEVVYEERLPASWTALAPTRYEQLVERLGGAGRPLLDLRGALADERTHDRPELRDFTYHPLGTHWTDRGCWRAAREIVRALSGACPRIAAEEREELQTSASDSIGDSWAARAFVQDLYPQPTFEVRPRGGFRYEESRTWFDQRSIVLRRGARPDGPRILLFRDSFGFRTEDFLAQSCSLLVQSNSARFEPRVVDAYEPDLVVQLYVDRALGKPLQPFAAPDDQPELIQRFREAGAPLWSLHPAQVGADELELDGLALADEGHALLRLQLDPARDGTLELCCPLAQGCGERRFVRAWPAGTGELVLRLRGPLSGQAPARLRVRPALEAVQALELVRENG